MVGLSVILESSNQGDFRTKSSQVISKSSVITKKNSSLQTPSFRLDSCFLCKHKLLPGNDIYMYKGDRGFCSVECRCRQIFMDEEESIMKDIKCSSTAAAASQTASSLSSESGSSSSSSMAASGNRKTTRNWRGEFAY